MCSSRQQPYSLQRRDWNFLEGGGFCTTKTFEGMYSMKLNWNFQEWRGEV